jgi:hypothetical protein
VLFDPTTEQQPSSRTPPKGWNRRLLAVHGFGCTGGWNIQGAAQGGLATAGFDFSLLNVGRLAEGWAIFTNTLQHPSNNCNAMLASEAASMSKEFFVKHHGVPDFTVSAGCSGGSYGSSLPADRLPGLFDGVLLACTYPDPLSIAFAGSDARLLARYFTERRPLQELDEGQQVAISGHKTLSAFMDAANQAGRIDPMAKRADMSGYVAGQFNAAVVNSMRYDPVTNPKGARGTLYDASRNVYGINPETGAALRPFDNVGVQYGLQTLNDGTLSFAQFLDLNEHIGGFDADANYVAGRSVGNVDAMRRAQEAGLQLSASAGLASIPVFDVTGQYDEDGRYHYQWFHFAVRERLGRANGNLDNYVMWRGDEVPAEKAWALFVDWVAAYKADTSGRSQREKVVAARPREAVDGCWKTSTDFIAETQTLGHDGKTLCNALWPSWTFPRRIAGGPISAHIMKCSLKPVDDADYSTKPTPVQLVRLRAVFPDGVCDWSKPGNYLPVVPDGSVGPSPRALIYQAPRLQ